MDQCEKDYYKVGYLKKESEIDGKWKKYFVKLYFTNAEYVFYIKNSLYMNPRNGTLSLFDNENDTIEKDIISLRNSTVKSAKEMIMLSNYSSVLFFCCNDEKEANEWKKAISDAIEGVLRHRNNRKSLVQEYISSITQGNSELLNHNKPLLSIINSSPMQRVQSLEDLLTSSLEDIKIKVASSGLDKCSTRSIYWKLLLGYFPEDCEYTSWPDIISKHRNHYETLKQKYLSPGPNTSSPLPLEELEELNSTVEFITHDITRTRSDDIFFTNESIQFLMLRVLILYTKEFPDIGYKQGMSDILAVIVLLLYIERYQWNEEIIPDGPFEGIYNTSALSSHNMNDIDTLLGTSKTAIIKLQDVQEVKDNHRESTFSLLHLLTDSQYIEHDSYILLCIIMSKMKLFFTPENTIISSGDSLERKLDTIQNSLLFSVDKEVSMFLNKMEINPAMYLLRWLRLLFSREFAIDGVFCIWDALFCEMSTEFDLLDFIAVSLLQKIRGNLLIQEEIPCLLKALKPFLSAEDAEEIVKNAKRYRNESGFYTVVGNDMTTTYEEESTFRHTGWDSPPTRIWKSNNQDISVLPSPLDLPRISLTAITPSGMSHHSTLSNSSIGSPILNGPPQPAEYRNSPAPVTLQLPAHMLNTTATNGTQ
ncbi:hypothetical protein WA158_007471 [Blastocystis sp. Blastoise]